MFFAVQTPRIRFPVLLQNLRFLHAVQAYMVAFMIAALSATACRL